MNVTISLIRTPTLLSINIVGVGAERITQKIFSDMSLTSELLIEMNNITHHLLQVSNSTKHTLLLNEGIPRALKGKKLRLKIPRVLPLIFELFLVFQI